MTFQQWLEQMEKLEKEARKSPWYIGHISQIEEDAADIDSEDGAICDNVYTAGNRNFIIASRTFIPQAIELIKKYREALEGALEVIKDSHAREGLDDKTGQKRQEEIMFLLETIDLEPWEKEK